ncbi:MAG: SemiSWEET transporter [Sulfuricaulis sp.]|nr:SemiSWEET transporter [Sulfuricaulis sp.]
MMELVNIVGFAAGALTTLAFVPQVIKIWKSKHARDISLGTFAIFSFGVTMWLLYGIQLGAVPIILANGMTLVLSLTILFFKIKYK